MMSLLMIPFIHENIVPPTSTRASLKGIVCTRDNSGSCELFGRLLGSRLQLNEGKGQGISLISLWLFPHTSLYYHFSFDFQKILMIAFYTTYKKSSV